MTKSDQDIINLEHHRSKQYPPMSQAARAAQFSPFAALTGHEAALRETQRLTERRKELDENEKTIVNQKLQLLQEYLPQQPVITVVYFEPDARKAGGAYREVSDRIKKIDSFRGLLILQAGVEIVIADILTVSSSLLDGFETEDDNGPANK